jgi:lipoyl(octanoyl) transferase
MSEYPIRECVVRDLGRMRYAEALAIQREIAEERKEGRGRDRLLLVEHPHVITIGRNGHEKNLLVSRERMAGAGIEYYETDRGGDVTYHGPGQAVGYPIMDLRLWKRDVGAFVRAIEQVMIDTLADFGIRAGRLGKCTGVWVGDAKIGAIGVHLSRWVSTHGWALNVAPEMKYFQYIVPCGLTKPVTSMAALGVRADMEDVKSSLARRFCEAFGFDMQAEPVLV